MLADFSFLVACSFSFSALLSRLLRSSMSNDLCSVSPELQMGIPAAFLTYIVLYCGGSTSAGSTLRLAGRIDIESIEPRRLLERAILPLRPSSTSGAY